MSRHDDSTESSGSSPPEDQYALGYAHGYASGCATANGHPLIFPDASSSPLPPSMYWPTRASNNGRPVDYTLFVDGDLRDIWRTRLCQSGQPSGGGAEGTTNGHVRANGPSVVNGAQPSGETPAGGEEGRTDTPTAF